MISDAPDPEVSAANLTRRVIGAGSTHARGPFLALVLLALAVPGVGAWADTAYRYDSRDRVVRTPSLYHVDRVVHFSDLGVALDDPRDFAVTGDGAVVLDSGNSRLVWLDAEYRLMRVQEEFTDGARTETLNHPQGVFVAGDGAVYVADTDNRRIVVLDSAGALVRILKEPANASFRIMSADYEYRPVKVGVNALGTVYVIVRNLFEGFMQLDGQGRFEGFVGAPRVVVSPVDLLWARIFSPEQRSRMTLSLPIDYRTIDFTSDGYLLITVAAGQGYGGEPIRKLSNSRVQGAHRMGRPHGAAGRPPLLLRRRAIGAGRRGRSAVGGVQRAGPAAGQDLHLRRRGLAAGRHGRARQPGGPVPHAGEHRCAGQRPGRSGQRHQEPGRDEADGPRPVRVRRPGPGGQRLPRRGGAAVGAGAGP